MALLIGLVSVGFTVIYAPYSRARRDRDVQRKQELLDAIKGSASLMASVPPGEVEAVVDDAFLFPDDSHDLDSEMQKKAYTQFFRDNVGGPSSNSLLTAPSYPWQMVELSADLKQTSANRFPNTVRHILRHALHLDQDTPPTATGGGARSEAPKQRLVWRFNLLYGASLKRQSRHYSSFFSEGVLQCPLRFNLDGYDNDWLRHISLEDLLNTLDQEPRVFLRKPGGFAWLYREVSLSLEFGRRAPLGLSSEEDVRFTVAGEVGRS